VRASGDFVSLLRFNLAGNLNMKNLSAIILLSLLSFFSCKKSDDSEEAQTGIDYPATVFFGNNILSFPDSTVLTDGGDYEMGAVLEADASLYLVITNYSPSDSMSPPPAWFYSNEAGWAVDDYNDAAGTQKFIHSQTGKISLEMYFMAFGQAGSCRIDFYENGNTVTRTKYFSWQ
jgi:hypothetical protein